MEHLGLKLIKGKYSFNINREEFALISTKPSLPVFESLIKENAYTDDTYTEYRLEWCEAYRELCLQNYDLNMKLFSLLEKSEFDSVLKKYLTENKGFKEVHDLSAFSMVEGYYMMVLDEYKQVYIGKSNDILKRIRQHWTKTKPLDRVLFPMYDVKHSCFSIDFFRALDTTRVFVWKRKVSAGMERKLVEAFPKKFCSNRIGGDITAGIEAQLTMNRRTLG